MKIFLIEARKIRRPYCDQRPFSVGRFQRLPREEFEIFREGGRRIDSGNPPRAAAPLVSVITVCRNAKETIQAAINSVKSQTYSNVEHIIVDGVSTDGTVDIIEANRDAIEYYLSAPDNGTYSAMNRALALAKGDYIAILNADDRILPQFVENSMQALQESHADISYCDYHTEHGRVYCPDIGDGLLFSQLDIKHNTFLIRKSCFERIGGFDESYKVVADAKWNRAAYLAGLSFIHIPHDLVFYSTQGASSAKTEALKDMIISESARLIIECFGFLDENEARSLYTSNFNSRSLAEILWLYNRYRSCDALFGDALRGFLRFNLARKSDYAADSSQPERVCKLIELCDAMGVSLTEIRFSNEDDPVASALSAIECIHSEIAEKDQRCVLHFARVFSAPSEPFIPNFVGQLARREPDRRHVMLCDERRLAQERPYDDVICIPWNELRGEMRNRLYQLMWARLEPVLIVAHFALNGYWLFQRLQGQQRYTPTINICHGIDVFAIAPGNEYSKYIQEYAAISPRVCFAPVSNYLAGVLSEAGVPDEKIFRVNNVISDGFLAHKKTGDFYRGDRALRILCVGRLIKWKGHDILLRALAAAKTRMQAGFELTIVYGKWDVELPNLKALATELGVADNIHFVPFVDFETETGYFAQFDLFVLPSTLSDDTPPRTETFGVALLEAIAAGLPVITTTTGGLPEVLGSPCDHAMLVNHGDEKSLSEALAYAVENCERVFNDNIEYARERLEEFSPDNQYRRFKEAEAWLLKKRPRVYHVSSLMRGGAAGATINIHKGLCEAGYDSVLVTRSSEKVPRFLPNIVQLSPETSFDFDQAQVKDDLKHKHTIFSIDDTIISNETLCALFSDADVVNFAWSAQFISSDNIAAVSRMGKPIVITLRDMNPISGGCHFFHGCEEWRRDCNDCPQLRENDDNFPHYVVRNKLETWNREAITFVCLSEHSRAILEEASVAQGVRIERVSNLIDADVFYLQDRQAARDAFDFPEDAFIIGYLPSFNSLVKGHIGLAAALKRLKTRHPDKKAVIALAADAPLSEGELSYDVIQIGMIDNIDRLRLFYNAVDAVAVPSLEETFSNTTVEALACGAPVVGFQTGVLAELLADEKLGSASPVGDVEGLAKGLERLLDADIDREYCSRTAHQKFSKTKQIARYDGLFRSLMTSPPSRRQLDAGARLAQLELSGALNHRRTARKVEGARRRLSGVRSQRDRFRRENSELKEALAQMMKGGFARRAVRKKVKRLLGNDVAAPQDMPLDPFDAKWLATHRSPVDLIIGGVPNAARQLLNGNKAAGLNRFSSLSVPKKIPTPPNFDEAAYLKANPDVKAGVDQGKVPSAYYHYLAFGRFEGRKRPRIMLRREAGK